MFPSIEAKKSGRPPEIVLTLMQNDEKNTEIEPEKSPRN